MTAKKAPAKKPAAKKTARRKKPAPPRVIERPDEGRESPLALLWPQHGKFLHELVASGSRIQAYRAAFPAAAELSNMDCSRRAWKLLQQADVRRAYDSLMAEVHERAVATRAHALREISRVALSDIGGIIGHGGKLLLPHELDPDIRAAVSSFKIDEFGRIEYKLWDKNAALEKLAKHLGLYERDHEQQADGLARLLAGLSGRVVQPVPLDGPERLDGVVEPGEDDEPDEAGPRTLGVARD